MCFCVCSVLTPIAPCVCQDLSLLEGRVTLRQVKAGCVVASQGDQVSLHANSHHCCCHALREGPGFNTFISALLLASQ